MYYHIFKNRLKPDTWDLIQFQKVDQLYDGEFINIIARIIQ